MRSEKSKRIGLAVCPDTDMTALMVGCEPMRAVNRFLAQPVYEIAMVASTLGVFEAENGTRVTPQTTFEDRDTHFDIVMVATMPKTSAPDQAMQNWFRFCGERDAVVCGLGGGVLALAAAGLLHGKQIAVPVLYRTKLRQDHPEIRVSDALYEFDGNAMTCVGGFASNDAFLKLVENDYGVEMARFVEADIISPPARVPFQWKPAIAPSHSMDQRGHLQKAQEIMRRNLIKPLDIADIAAEMNLSVRRLQLLSRQHLDQTLSERYLDIRLDVAQRMLIQSEKPIAEIASETGFGSASSFRRAFKRRLGINSAEFRKKFQRSGSQPKVSANVVAT